MYGREENNREKFEKNQKKNRKEQKPEDTRNSAERPMDSFFGNKWRGIL